MREIKFRAWDILEKKMYSVLEISWIRNTITINKLKEKGKWKVPDMIFLDDVELMQYTGLKDKSNPPKEIYEGDMLDNNTRATTPLIVKWSKSWGQWALHGHNHEVHKGFVNSIRRVRKLKVIGNIYENPELLK